MTRSFFSWYFRPGLDHPKSIGKNRRDGNSGANGKYIFILTDNMQEKFKVK
jgi:hypothetical protein